MPGENSSVVHLNNICAMLVSLLQYASVQKDGEMFMSGYDFIQRFLGLLPENYEPETLKLLAGAADTTKDGYV